MSFSVDSIDKLLPGDLVRIKQGVGIKGSGNWLSFKRYDPETDKVLGSSIVGHRYYSSRYEDHWVKLSNLDLSECSRSSCDWEAREKFKNFYRECLIS